jgi:hypothetical protein
MPTSHSKSYKKSDHWVTRQVPIFKDEIINRMLQMFFDSWSVFLAYSTKQDWTFKQSWLLFL